PTSVSGHDDHHPRSDTNRPSRTDQEGPARPAVDWLAETRRAPLYAAGQRQPPRFEPQPDSGADRSCRRAHAAPGAAPGGRRRAAADTGHRIAWLDGLRRPRVAAARVAVKRPASEPTDSPDARPAHARAAHRRLQLRA